MAVKLTGILLLVIFAVLQFGGRDLTESPFAEVTLAGAEADAEPVARNDDDTALVTRQVAPRTELPAATDAADVPRIDTGSVLDMVVLDPDTARDGLGGSLGGAVVTPAAAAAAPASAPTPAPAATPRQMAEVTGNAVNLRAGPSTGNAVLGRAIAGDVVEWVSDAAPGWALIRHPGLDTDAYMSSRYLKRIDN